MSEQHNYLPEVRAQYEDYPYPRRDPAEEKSRIYRSASDCLERVNHFCFNGKRDFFNKPFRCLIAGGGTGDAVIHLAEQLLCNPQAEIHYIDLSDSSMKIAQERAKMRQLENIHWHQGSLLDLPKLGWGKFDYINCSGVLHHLADPVAGLKALEAVMADDGAMAIMVYGTFGRMEIYLMQHLMRLVNDGVDHPQEKVENTKKVFRVLHSQHPFRVNMERWKAEIVTNGDIGVFDLLLHSQDRPYTVPEVYEWNRECGLEPVEFLEMQGQRLMYTPEAYLTHSPDLLAKVKDMPKDKRLAIAEALSGGMPKHVFYTKHTKYADSVAKYRDVEMVPFFFLGKVEGAQLAKEMARYPDKAFGFSPNGSIRVNIKADPWVALMIKYMDNKRSFGEIFDAVRADPACPDASYTNEQLFDVFAPTYEQMELAEVMLLRHKSVPDYHHMSLHLQDRVLDLYPEMRKKDQKSA